MIRSRTLHLPSRCSHPQSLKAKEPIRCRTNLFGCSLNQRQHRMWIFSCPCELKETQYLGYSFPPAWSLAMPMDGRERRPGRGSRSCLVVLPSPSNRIENYIGLRRYLFFDNWFSCESNPFKVCGLDNSVLFPRKERKIDWGWLQKKGRINSLDFLSFMGFRKTLLVVCFYASIFLNICRWSGGRADNGIYVLFYVEKSVWPIPPIWDWLFPQGTRFEKFARWSIFTF